MIGKQTEKKKRLLIVLNRLVIGGPAVDILSMAGLLLQELDVMLVYGEKEPHEIEATYLLRKYPYVKVQKLDRIRRSPNPLIDLLALLQVFRCMMEYRPDFVHTHGAKSGFFGRFAAWALSVPVVVHTFHGHVFHSYYGDVQSKMIVKTERLMAKFCTDIIALSKYQLYELTSIYRIAPIEKFSIVPLGIDQAYFSEQADSRRNHFRSSHGLQEADVAIGIVSRIVPIKNHILFLNVAIGIIQKMGVEAPRFFIVGDGDTTSILYSVLEKSGVEYSTPRDPRPNAKVSFTSWISDIAEVYHGLDIVALSSHNEGTPLSLIEAQFCGRPVVATNVGGVKDVVIDGETGWLVPPNNAEKFADKLIGLSKNKETLSVMSKKAHEYAKNHFSLTAQVRSTIDLYEKRLEVRLKSR